MTGINIWEIVGALLILFCGGILEETTQGAALGLIKDAK